MSSQSPQRRIYRVEFRTQDVEGHLESAGNALEHAGVLVYAEDHRDAESLVLARMPNIEITLVEEVRTPNLGGPE